MGASARQREVKKRQRAAPSPAAGTAIYLYGISLAGKARSPSIMAEGVDGSSPVESMISDGFVCWFSRVDHKEYGEDLPRNMDSLDWLAAASVRHQGVVGELSTKVELLPARFGTVFLSDASLRKHVTETKTAMLAIFRKISGAVEWGIKMFREPGSAQPTPVTAASGTDYLRRKASVARPKSFSDDPVLVAFTRELEKLSIDVAPGGKASSGQPGLIWHRSFLVKKRAEKKFSLILRNYSRKLAGEYRIECSGPWPAYSFVGHHGG